ncbi:MAG: alpha/beta fold hydrolase [Dehalococcoidia bacterium]
MEQPEFMPHARVGDCLLYCNERGSGPPLLLLMGLGGSYRSWGRAFLDALARDFRVIALDHRGTGRSTRGRAPYTLAQLAGDAAGALAALHIERAHVFGLSMGGMVAQELALAHGDRVGGLVLASTNCGGREAIWPGPSARRAFFEGLTQGDSFWPLVVTPEFAAANAPFLQRITFDTLTSGTTPSVLREQAGAIRQFSTFSRLGELQAPTLVMAGDRDALIPAENARILRQRISGAEGVLVKDTGHVFVWEAAERAAHAVTGFLHGAPADRLARTEIPA